MNWGVRQPVILIEYCRRPYHGLVTHRSFPMPDRCAWCGTDPLYTAYHDLEWGVPNHDDRHLFEMLVLEGAQAGLSWISPRACACAGLSPRTRGNPRCGVSDAACAGPIPADAGEPRAPTRCGTRRRAYPRGRGGTGQVIEPLGAVWGLSPRTRGNQLFFAGERVEGGPIPADAGEPNCASRSSRS